MSTYCMFYSIVLVFDEIVHVAGSWSYSILVFLFLLYSYYFLILLCIDPVVIPFSVFIIIMCGHLYVIL